MAVGVGDGRGQDIPHGQVLGHVGVAHDHVFRDPETFDITKEASSPHLTFGSGTHFCLGAWLARAELQEALPVLARRLPGLIVDGAIEWKPNTVGIWGPARLPLVYTPT